MKAKDLTGRVFGRLTVLEQAENTSYGSTAWKVKCSCKDKTVKTVVGASLKSGHSRSCGCAQIERAENRKLEKGRAARNNIVRKYKWGAKERNLEFNLTDGDLDKLFTADCFYCGTPPSNKYEQDDLYGAFIYSGIDRVDNTKGYSRGNCVSCCGTCNHAKKDMSLKDYVQFIKQTYKHIEPMLAPEVR